MHWQVQDAKQRFSEVVRAAEAGEVQIVTRHGTPVVVVLDVEEYLRLNAHKPSLMEYLRAEPHVDTDLEVERGRDLPRDVDLTM